EPEELPGLPREHLVGHALEGLAEHREAAALDVAGAEMQVAERAAAAAVAPLRREHDEVERARALHLEPRLAAPAGSVRAGQRLRHDTLVALRDRLRQERGRFVRARRDDPRHEPLR